MEESVFDVFAGSAFGIMLIFLTYQQFSEFKGKLNLKDLFWAIVFGLAALLFIGTSIYTAYEHFVVIPKIYDFVHVSLEVNNYGGKCS